MRMLDDLDDRKGNSRLQFQRNSSMAHNYSRKGLNTPDEVDTVKNSMIKNLKVVDNKLRPEDLYGVN